MTNEIFIENKQVDVSEGLSNLLNFAIDDIKDIGSRNTSFSKTIVLPGTARNNALFGHIFDVTVMNPYDSTQPNSGLNFNPSVEARCLIFQNHIQVFKGVVQLLEVVVNNNIPEYECAVFGELGGLINAIGNLKIHDLDFSAYDHELTIPNVTGSWDSFNGSGYFYPLADYGNVSTDKIDYQLSAFRPALAVREYLDKIITNAGYSYTAPLFDTARFKKLIVPNNQKTFQQLSNIQLSVNRATSYLAISNVGPSSPQSLKFVNLPVLGSFSANVDNNEFTYGGADTIQTTFNIEFLATVVGQFYTFTFNLLKNGNPIYDFGDVYRASASPVTFAKQVSDLAVAVAPGDVFEIEMTVIAGGGLGAYSVSILEGVWEIRTANDVYIDINLGDDIVVSETIPRNILQRDFFSSILRLFNLYVYDDKLKDKFLNISPYVDFYNVSGVIDWTYKLDRSKEWRLKPMSELNSRYYDFKFKSDSDYYNELYSKRYNEGYGDYLFDSEYFATPDSSSIDLIFSATPLVGYSGVDKIVSTYLKISNGVEDSTAVNIRILQAKKVTGVTSWAIKDGVSTLVSGLTDYGYAGHYDDPDAPANDIHFGVPRELFFTLATGAINVTQFNVYWSAYMAEITDKDSKLLTASFKLTNSDIYNLDFSKFIYIDGSYFRLNKIIDWNSSEPDVCKCELLKVIYNQY